MSLPSPARVVTVNLGTIRELVWRDRVFRTAIDKRPVQGRRALGTLGFEGDVQGDRKVHGGVDKAVYAYAADHHAFWSETLGKAVGPGSFGENLTVQGLVEDEVRIGDRVRVGTALLEASEPRQPCATLAAFHRRPDLPRIFAEAAWPGIYFRVLEEGEVGAGDPVERVARGAGDWTVKTVFELVMGRRELPEDLDDLLEHPALSPATRRALERRRGGGD